MDLIKYDMTDIWAVAGDVVAPTSAKIRAGWGVEVVPRQWWNWFENRQDQNIAYMLQKGFPEWDATTEYIINKSYVQRSGIVYKATATSTNSDPVALTSWVRAFANYTVAGNALGAITPAANVLPYFTSTTAAATTSLTAFARTLLDDADAATMRGTIAAQALNANLTALAGVTPVVNGLPYFTSTTAMGIANLTAFARTILDDADAATMRATLGLGAAATATLTSGNADGTVGRVTTVGDYGWGAGSNGLAAMDPPSNGTAGDANLCTLSGVYRIASTTVNTPAGFGQGALMITMMWNNATGSQVIYQNGNSAVRQGTGLATTPVWSSWNVSWHSGNLVKTTSQTDNTVGSILKVGDFGIGATINPAATDANAVTVSGMYSFSNGATLSNIPVAGSNGMLIHSNWAGSNAGSQIFFTTSDGAGRMFFRTKTSDAWQAWKEVINTSNQQAIIDTAVAAAGVSAASLYLPKAGGVMTGSLVIDNPTSGNMSIEMGSKTRANTPFIDFNSSAGGTDYDSRIIASGGTTTVGQGVLTYSAKGGHNFTTGVVSATDGFSGDLAGNVTGNVTGNTSGSAGSAAKWTTPRTLAITGDVVGSVSIDGSANATLTAVLGTSGVAAGTYGTVTVNTQGRVTAATTATAIANGGTGATSAATARSNLGIQPLGFTALTLVNGWSIISGRRAGYRLFLDMVQLEVQIGGGTSADGTLLFTLPVGARPPFAITIPVSSGAPNAITAGVPGVTINPNGTVTTYNCSGATGVGFVIQFSVT